MAVVADDGRVQVAVTVDLRGAEEGDRVQASIGDVAERLDEAGVEVGVGHDAGIGHSHRQFFELWPDSPGLEEDVRPRGVDALGDGRRQHRHARPGEEHIAVLDEAAGGDGHHLARGVCGRRSGRSAGRRGGGRVCRVGHLPHLLSRPGA